MLHLDWMFELENVLLHLPLFLDRFLGQVDLFNVLRILNEPLFSLSKVVVFTSQLFSLHLALLHHMLIGVSFELIKVKVILICLQPVLLLFPCQVIYNLVHLLAKLFNFLFENRPQLLFSLCLDSLCNFLLQLLLLLELLL